MSTEPNVPDAKVVRGIARTAIERAAKRRDYIGAAITDHDVMGEILASGDRSAYGRWNDAVRAEMETAAVTVSWPDEQPQDERDVEILRFRTLLGIGIDRDQWDAIAEAEGARFEYEQTDDNLVGYLAYRYEDIKAQRHILLREIEDAQDERDGDVRAVRALTQAASRMLGTWAEANEAVRRELWTTLHDRADDVFDRYRERYAELDAKAADQ